MLIVGVLCIVAAVLAIAFGVRTLRRPLTGDPEQLVLRAVAPAQLAAGLILGVGGVIAVAGSTAVGLLAVMIAVTGALGTLAAGSWQGARFAARQQELAMAEAAAAGGGGCGGECGCSGGGAPVEAAEPEPAAPASMPDAMLGSIMLSGISGGAAAGNSGGGCGDGCGCSGGGEPAPSPASGGCGDGCGCG